MENNNFEWTKKLIQKCLADKDYQKLNTRDRFNETGFILACKYQLELAEMMLRRDDIDFNTQNKKGETEFMMACKYEPELVKIMLNNKKIDKNLKNNKGLTGYDIAKKYNQESFNIYQSWLEHKNINNQVQKRTKKPKKHL